MGRGTVFNNDMIHEEGSLFSDEIQNKVTKRRSDEKIYQLV